MNGPYTIVAKHVTGCSIFSTVQGFWLDYGSHTLMLLCALVTHHLSPSGKASLFQGPLTSACNQIGQQAECGPGTPSFPVQVLSPSFGKQNLPTKTWDRKAECLPCCTHTLIWHRVHQEIQEQLETQAKMECRWTLPHPHTMIFYSTSHSSAQSFHAVVAVFSTSCCMHVEQGATLTLTLLDLGPSWT